MIPVSPGQSSNAYSNYDKGKVFLIWWGYISFVSSVLHKDKEKKGEEGGIWMLAVWIFGVWKNDWCESGMWGTRAE